MKNDKLKKGIYWYKETNDAVAMLFDDQDGWNIVRVMLCVGGTRISFLQPHLHDCWLKELSGKFVGPIETPEGKEK